MVEMNELIDSIAGTTKDYKGGGVITSKHITKWVNQFEPADRYVILNELDVILKKYYVSREKAKQFLLSVLQKKEIVGDLKQNYRHVKFLNIQNKGSSQKELIELMNEVLIEEYNLTINDCGTTPNIYIYLDDCYFSGNTMHRDIERWAETAVTGSKLHFVFFGIYNASIEYIKKKINPSLSPKSISYEFWRIHEFNNNTRKTESYDCVWSTKIVGDENIDFFVKHILEKRQEKGMTEEGLFRAENIPTQEGLFSSTSNRLIVESAFFKKGAYIYKIPKKQQNPSMKPLGYTYLHNLGFGSLFVTYRNIANNSPLVLWWGDPNKPYPLNAWYPLFPRNTNKV